MSVITSKVISQFLRIWLLSIFTLAIFLGMGDLSIEDGGIIVGNSTIQQTFAETASGSTVNGVDSVSTTISALIDLGNLFIGVLTFLITPLIMLAGWLLSPDWTFGEIFGLRPILHQVWIFISNVIYVVFGFMLVAIAFANIFGAGGGEYEMKKMLPRLVIGILIVPFTWFIVSAVLSVSNILVASVISLPMETIMKAGWTTTGMFDKKIIPTDIVFDKNAEAWTGTVDSNWDALNTNTDTGSMEYKKSWAFYATDCDKEGNDCLTIQEFLTQGWGGAYNLLSVYAYGIFQIQKYKLITPGQQIGKIGDIASKLSFGFIFFVIFGILVIAIVYALLSRAIMLWMFAIFSPLFALSFVLWHGKGKVAEKVANFSIGHFISLAMVPVYVSAALAFGLMFLWLVMGATGQSTGATGELQSNSKDIKITSTKEWDSTFKFGLVSLTTKWLISGNDSDNLNGALSMGKGIIGTIIMNILALVILWMAVMAALSADHITEHAIKPIAEMGNSVGELAKHSPSYIPIPGTNWQSMKSVTQWVSNIKSGIEQNVSTRANEITRKFWQADAASRNQAITDTTKAIADGVKPKIGEEFQKLKNTYTNYGEFVADGRAREVMKNMGQKFGVDPKLMENLSTKENMTKFLSALDEKWKPQVELFHMDNFAENVPYMESEFQNKSSGQPTGVTEQVTAETKERTSWVYDASLKRWGNTVNIEIKNGRVDIPKEKDDLISSYKNLYKEEKDLVVALKRDLNHIDEAHAKEIAQAIWDKVEKKGS